MHRLSAFVLVFLLVSSPALALAHGQDAMVSFAGSLCGILVVGAVAAINVEGARWRITAFVLPFLTVSLLGSMPPSALPDWTWASPSGAFVYGFVPPSIAAALVVVTSRLLRPVGPEDP